MNKDVVVEGNRKVELSQIIQYRTYSNVLEGTPGLKMNEILKWRGIELAKERFYVPVTLLFEPKQIALDQYWLFPEDAAERLPNTTCLAKLYDYRCNGDYYAALGVVWFQDDYAFPIDKEALQALKKLPFSELSDKFEF